MIKYRVKDLLALNLGTAFNLDTLGRSRIPAISTDSRTMRAGEAFLALRGDTFDGHAFVERAFAEGALCCIVDQAWYRAAGESYSTRPILVVPDAMRAYGDIARSYRAGFSLPVLIITGSNGKTTTRALTAAILGTKFSVLATTGNLNNHIGLPRTVLTLRNAHDVAVLEAGTNQPGDMAYLCSIAQQTHGLITNIGRAHLERLESREGIAHEKSVVYGTLPDDGTAFINVDEPLLKRAVGRGRQRVTFGTSRSASFRVTDVSLNRHGCATFFFQAAPYLKKPMKVSLRVAGRHNVMNVAAALSVGFTFGCSSTAMKSVVQQWTAFDKRSQVIDRSGVTIIDDSYNANPDSVVAAIDTLVSMRCKGTKVAVLGDMLELGPASRQEHRLVGEYLATRRIPYVLTFGSHSALIASMQDSAVLAQHFTDRDMLASALKELLQPGDLVLIKGSRGMRMDELVNVLSRQQEGMA